RDYNGEDQEGVVKTQASISGGRRMSVAHCYLKPAMRRPNLDILTEAPTRRVLLEGTRCVGVVYERWGRRVEVRAGREVILSAGGGGAGKPRPDAGSDSAPPIRRTARGGRRAAVARAGVGVEYYHHM